MVLRWRSGSRRGCAPSLVELLGQLVEAAFDSGVVIRGDVGSGKTTLAVAIARSASHAGSVVHYIGRPSHATLFEEWPKINTRTCVDCDQRELALGRLVESLRANDVVVADDDGSPLPPFLGTHRRLVVTTSRHDPPGWFDLGTEHRSILELATNSPADGLRTAYWRDHSLRLRALDFIPVAEHRSASGPREEQLA